MAHGPSTTPNPTPDTNNAASSLHSPQHHTPQQHSHTRAANALMGSSTGTPPPHLLPPTLSVESMPLQVVTARTVTPGGQETDRRQNTTGVTGGQSCGHHAERGAPTGSTPQKAAPRLAVRTITKRSLTSTSQQRITFKAWQGPPD